MQIPFSSAALFVIPVFFSVVAEAQMPKSATWSVETSTGGASAIRGGNQAGGPIFEVVTVRKPTPVKTVAGLSRINPELPKVLPGLTNLMKTAELSSRWDELYASKLATLKSGAVLTPHNWFDCETILRLEHPETGQKVLLVQADMDCVTDGSDPDRRSTLADYNTARISNWYLPETSLSWAKTTTNRNPFLDYYPGAVGRLKEMRKQIEAESARDGGVVWRELLASCDSQIYRANARGMGTQTRLSLSKRSYLLATDDPFIVLPKGWVTSKAPFAPNIGDYAAVVVGGRIFPAVLGDAGPNDKVGEASLKLAIAINPKASGTRRAVDSLGVTYLYFPKSGRASTPPNLTVWRSNVQALVNRIGGLGEGIELHQF